MTKFYYAKFSFAHLLRLSCQKLEAQNCLEMPRNHSAVTLLEYFMCLVGFYIINYLWCVGHGRVARSYYRLTCSPAMEWHIRSAMSSKYIEITYKSVMFRPYKGFNLLKYCAMYFKFVKLSKIHIILRYPLLRKIMATYNTWPDILKIRSRLLLKTGLTRKALDPSVMKGNIFKPQCMKIEDHGRCF